MPSLVTVPRALSMHGWTSSLFFPLLRSSFSTSAVRLPLRTSRKRELLHAVMIEVQKTPEPLKLSALYEFGQDVSLARLIMAAEYLRTQLPCRLAHRIHDLYCLPNFLSEMSSVQTVRDWYLQSFDEIYQYAPIRNRSLLEDFTDLLRTIKQRHRPVVVTMAKGVLELKETLRTDVLGEGVHNFLDRFYLSRIAIRLMIGHHLMLMDPPKPGHVGMIMTDCSPREVIEDAVANATQLCLEQYQACPPVNITGDLHCVFPYIPGHINHMIFELAKNSMRAVVETHGLEGKNLPPVNIMIAEGNEDVSFRVSDMGGGIARSAWPKLFTYLFTTGTAPSLQPETPYESTFAAPMSGFGYGLNLARCYARFFGGDLQVVSLDGKGTDAFVHIPKLDINKKGEHIVHPWEDRFFATERYNPCGGIHGEVSRLYSTGSP